MPRRLRVATGGLAYHVLNRAVGRGRLFDDDADYLAMERVIDRTHKQLAMRMISYCLMPNHWHMVLWPREDGELSEFMRPPAGKNRKFHALNTASAPILS